MVVGTQMVAKLPHGLILLITNLTIKLFIHLLYLRLQRLFPHRFLLPLLPQLLRLHHLNIEQLSRTSRIIRRLIILFLLPQPIPQTSINQLKRLHNPTIPFFAQWLVLLPPHF